MNYHFNGIYNNFRYGAYLFKAFPLDMSQFVGLFGGTRIPELTKDKIYRDPTSKHILVQRKGHFYMFDVLDSNGIIFILLIMQLCVKFRNHITLLLNKIHLRLHF